MTVLDQIGESLQDIFNEHDASLGAHIVGDWFVIAEVHTADSDGPTLRILSKKGMPVWRKQGMLAFALGDVANDVLLYRMEDEE